MNPAIVKEFKDFILRGNVVELAVAVVIGTAFAAVVGTIVDGLVDPLISMFVGENSLDTMTFEINDAVFAYGAVISALIYFVSVAAVVFFFVIKPMNMLLARTKKEQPPAPPPPAELSAEAKRFLDEMTEALRKLS